MNLPFEANFCRTDAVLYNTTWQSVCEIIGTIKQASFCHISLEVSLFELDIDSDTFVKECEIYFDLRLNDFNSNSLILRDIIGTITERLKCNQKSRILQSQDTSNFLTLDEKILKSIRLSALKLPEILLDKELLDIDVLREYRRVFDGIEGIEALKRSLIQSLSTSLRSPGYVVVDGLLPNTGTTSEKDLVIVTAICSLIGHPFRVIDTALHLWNHLGVNLNIEPWRFSGTGYNSFHIDVPNSTAPPDFFCLLCIRPDPYGGGQTIISDLQLAVSKLSDVEKEKLQEPKFFEGSFYGMSGVGEAMLPFPVLQKTCFGMWRTRFSGKMINHPQNANYKDLLLKFEAFLIESQEVFMLEAGQLIIGNQLLVAHGRLPLGPQQYKIPEENRRYLRQMKLKSDLCEYKPELEAYISE